MKQLYPFVVGIVLALVALVPGSAHAQRGERVAAPRVPEDRGVAASDAPDLWFATAEGFRALRLQDVAVSESLGTLPTIDVTLWTDEPRFDSEDLLGQLVTVGVRTGRSSFRVRSAYVVSVSSPVQRGSDDEPRFAMHAQLAPWLYALTRTSHYAFFENVSPLDVLRAVFARYPIASVDYRVHGTYPARDLIAQYGESDFELVDRVMADAGLYYYFEHDAHGHRLIVTDAPPERRGARVVVTEGPLDAPNGFSLFRGEARVEPTLYRLPDPRDPSRRAFVEHRIHRPTALGELTFDDREASDARVRATIASLEGMRVATASTTNPTLERGMVFTVRGHADPRSDGDYRIVSSDFNAMAIPGQPLALESTLQLLPAQSAIPIAEVRGGRILGPEIATVIALPGQGEPSGRARVRFPWPASPEGRAPEAWVPIVGASRPRVGEAVLIQFMRGDPSRPVISSAPDAR